MLRSTVAVVTGFVLIVALAFGADLVLRSAMPDAIDAAGRVESVPVLLLISAYMGLFIAFGCYVTARLAPDRPMRHALILGGLGLASTVAGSVAGWGTQPDWWHVLSVVTVMLWAWLGGRIREWELARRAPRATVRFG